MIAFLFQIILRNKGRDSGITTSAVNTNNILIKDGESQHWLFGESSEATIHKLNRENLHQRVNKTDVEKVKSDLERDLDVATALVKNISDSGDELYYNAEKNEDSSFIVSKKTSDCEHISCLDIENDNSPQLKALIYSDDILTEEQAKLLSKISIAGMLNFTREEKVASAILYGDDLASLDDLGVILNRGNAGYWNEFLYAGFERFRAWVNMPMVFGASNATKDHAQIVKKLDEYNAYAAANGKPQYKLQDTAHSLGVSEHKNMLNWSEYLNQDYKNTEVDYLHAGGSYPSEEIDHQAKGIFKDTNTRYIGVDGDKVYSGILGGHFIGNNKNAVPNNGISGLEAHSEANQNINNLKFVDDKETIKYKSNILNKTHNNGVRQYNVIGEKQ
ncbi:hypothetical protein P7L95_09775 [Bisgaard Taxon 10/6]|uniref:hypothetical protein n=1 Tax=Exercitatus varius TaxID=67857 RepID=UPI00294B6940|nr:hypothetical protein [Exercitatus varius]MDG2957030.1 hypothetical protein [Exercitatus varius]MDG2964653.1 hypothetical protein [Exercitatus varius]